METNNGIYWMFYLTNGFSLLGSAALLLLIFKTPLPRPSSLNLIAVLAFADLILALDAIMNVVFPHTLLFCEINQFITAFGIYFSLFWSAVISLFSYRCLSQSSFNGKQFILRYTFTSIILSSILALMPITNIIAFDYWTLGPICYGLPAYVYDSLHNLLLYVYILLPFMAAILVSLGCYFAQYRYLQRNPDLAETLQIRIHKLFIYPSAQIFLFGPFLISIIYAIIISHDSSELVGIEYGFTHMCGAVNFLVYGWQRKSQLLQKNNINDTQLKSFKADSDLSFDGV